MSEELQNAFRKAVKEIFVECIQEYNQAQEIALENYRESQKKPMIIRLSIPAFWEEVDNANRDSRIAEIERVINESIINALG